MSKPDPLTYIPLWQAALEAEIGIYIEVDQPAILRTLLYQARSLADNPAFEEIIMFLPPSGDKVFLARKSVELDP